LVTSGLRKKHPSSKLSGLNHNSDDGAREVAIVDRFLCLPSRQVLGLIRAYKEIVHVG